MPPYPPDRHLLRDLRFSMLRTPGRPDQVYMPIPAQLRSPEGVVSLGALAVAVDLAAAGVAMRTIAPDWLATAELEIHAQQTRAPSSVAVAVAEPTLLRSGKTTAVFDVDVTGHGAEEEIGTQEGVPLAHSTMTFVRIARPDLTTDLEHPAEPTQATRTDFALAGSGLQRSLYEELDLRVLDPAVGRLALPSEEFSKNSFGSLQGGIVATLAQAACETAASTRRGRPVAATDLSVHYLAQGSGPYESRCTLLRTSDRADLYRVEIHDSRAGVLMATAAASTIAL